MRKVTIAVAVILAIAAGVFFVSRSGSSEEAAFTLVPIERGSIVDKALATGQIVPKQEYQVKSQISGIVSACFVDVGDRVSAGDRLLEINPNPTPLELTEGERNVELAEIGFQRAESEHRRVASLRESGLLPEDEYDVARKEFDQARVGLALSRERLALLKEGRINNGARSVDSVIRAESAGTVLERMVDPGDPVVPLTSYQAGTELLTIADMDGLIFDGTVDEIDVGKLTEGLPVRINVGALPDAEITGRLARIAPKATEVDGSTLFDVEAVIEDRGDALLRAGYSANADIIIREKNDVLLVPERLLLFEGDKVYVETPPEEPGGEPVRREIAIGLSDGMMAEVLSGLEEGESVVQRPPREI